MGTALKEERRQFKRYSAVPIKVYLKRDGEFRSNEMIDISLGGMQIRTNVDFCIYEKYECQIEIPLAEGKDLIYTKAMVWRIEPDTVNMKYGKRFVAFRFEDIEEYDKVVISEFLTRFEEDVPYS
ncbi:MAG: PilZ domain-containing protein [Deferribacterales bacterium]